MLKKIILLKLLFIVFFTSALFNCGLLSRCFAQAAGELKDRKISLDLKNMDITDVLKVFSQEAGLNLVIGKDVSGRTTLFLKDVGVWDAFNIVILSADLAYEENAGIINVMSGRGYEMLRGKKFSDKRKILVLRLKFANASAVAQVINQLKSNVGTVVTDEGSNSLFVVDSPDRLAYMENIAKEIDLPMKTKIFALNYAKAEDVKTKIQDMVSKPSGSLQVDSRTNKIAVTDYPGKLRGIEKIIKAFDEKNRQVLIDAKIIEIMPQDSFKMGVDWDYWMAKNVRAVNLLPAGTPNKISIGKEAASLALTENKEYRGIVDALRTIGNTKILSSPRIVAINNQDAKILVGTKEAYLTETVSQPSSGTSVTATQVNFVDVGVQLFVSPSINKEGFITMKIRPVVSSAEYLNLTSKDQKTQVPIVSTSEAETSVMVKDGITVMIAGLKKDRKSKEVKKFPILGDIPLLGFFFRSTSDAVAKNELVIFLTPRIISGDKAVEYQTLTGDRDISNSVE